MSFLGGVFKSMLNPMTIAQLAMGPAGWASIAMKAVVSAVAQQVIQQLGQKLGLPQSVIDMAQTAFTQSAGLGNGGSLAQSLTQSRGNPIADVVKSLAQQFNLTPSQEGQLQRSADKYYDGVNKLVDNMAKKLSQGDDEEGNGGTSSSQGGGSVLMRIARALGKAMDDKMNAMAKKGDQLGNLGNDGALTKDGNFNAKGQSQYGKLSGEMQALGQELSILSQALSNTLKSIGESASTLARKN